MINPNVYSDPAGTLTIGLIALVWGMVVFLFHEHLFFPKKSKSERGRKWEKPFFQVCSGMVIFGGLYQVCVGAWVLLTHGSLHQ
jgi:hypothetical protein